MVLPSYVPNDIENFQGQKNVAFLLIGPKIRHAFKNICILLLYDPSVTLICSDSKMPIQVSNPIKICNK